MLMLNWFQDLVKENISGKDADLHRDDTPFLMLMLNWFQDLVKGNISEKDTDLHRHDTPF